LELTFAMPSPALATHVSIYYLIRFDYPVIEDQERADVGYLRFMFSGDGAYRFKSGALDASCPVMLLGPATEVANYTVNGPLYTFGAVLLPEFWGGIADCDATDFANRALDASSVFGSEVLGLFGELKGMATVEEMARRMDAWLLRRVKPVPEDHLKVMAKIGEWLSCLPIPSPERLYEEAGKSARQVMRLANRHFGAPPKLLARKFRALRTASRLIGTRGPIPESLIAEYSDQAHMIREIKAFTGMTPRQLQVNSSPIMQVTLHPDNFRAEAPWT
jgi:AraC-like DNA-binding protein